MSLASKMKLKTTTLKSETNSHVSKSTFLKNKLHNNIITSINTPAQILRTCPLVRIDYPKYLTTRWCKIEACFRTTSSTPSIILTGSPPSTRSTMSIPTGPKLPAHFCPQLEWYLLWRTRRKILPTIFHVLKIQFKIKKILSKWKLPMRLFSEVHLIMNTRASALLSLSVLLSRSPLSTRANRWNRRSQCLSQLHWT
jgi:hypothetical protein